MAGRTAGVGKVAVATLLLLVIPLAVHVAILNSDWPFLVPAIATLQLIVFGAAFAARQPRIRKWLIVALAALIPALVWMGGAAFGSNALPGVPHAVAYLGLLIGFGMSLLPGRTAVLTRMATSLRGTLPDELLVYTRRVTAAWCCFFAMQLVVSLYLYTRAPLAQWSFFINVLNLPLVLLMFAVEYGYRLTRFRAYPHSSVSDMIHAAANMTRRGARQS